MATIYKENTAGDANANSAKLAAARVAAENGVTTTYANDGTPKFTQTGLSTMGSSGSGGSGSSGIQSSNPNNQSMSQSSYEQKLIDYQTQVAQAAAASKQAALKSAWESNSQALNSQNATVDNNFNSAKNNLAALQASRTPEYQAQKDATSQEAAAQLRRTQALNAMTGNYNSGYNRSQMNDVGLSRQGSLDAVQTSQNAFNTDVGNQISAADAQRVAALNDIAGKLSLGQQQYNDGTLNVSNQLTSDIATGSLKASLDSQAWADQQRQLGADNSARDAQLALSTKIANAQTAYQQGQLSLEQANSAISNAIATSGVTGRIPDVLTSTYPSSPATTKLPDSVASQYPGATNVVKAGGGYRFTYNGVTQWYYPQ